MRLRFGLFTIFSLLLCSDAFASPSESVLVRKLYNFVFETQDHTDPAGRGYGVWPSNYYTIKDGKPTSFTKENEIFFALFTVNILKDSSHYMFFPRVFDLMRFTEDQVDAYLQDNVIKKSPAGTIAFWPVWKLTNGYMRGPSPTSPLTQIDFPTDLDDSAQAAIWFMNSGFHYKFIHSFIQNLATFRDSNRKVQSPLDDRWKKVNSGAFLTWAIDPADPSASTNDVDMAVNLNVAGAISIYEHHYGQAAVPRSVKEGQVDICRLLDLSLAAMSKTGLPGGLNYYDKLQDFVLAFARAKEAGVGCLAYKVDAVRKILDDAIQSPSKIDQSDPRVLIALKKLYTPRERLLHPRVNQMILRLTRALVSTITERGNIAYIAKTMDFFTGPDRSLFWDSPAFRAVEAIQALVIP